MELNKVKFHLKSYQQTLCKDLVRFFLVFWQISVKQKPDRAQTTFCFWVASIFCRARRSPDWPQRKS